MSLAVAVDIGGTFTDLVAFDRESEEVVYAKSPTTYADFVDGIRNCFGAAGVRAAEAGLVNHGTTLVINSLIERKGARTALVTSAGFRDVLEIGRANRPDPFDLYYKRDEPLIPRELRFEVPERLDARGEVVTPLDTGAVEDVAQQLAGLGVEAVAVFFMNSYLDDTHERQAAEILKRRLPGVFVTHSTELTREWYEYERTSTAAANAYVGPEVSSYVRRLEGDLKGRGFGGSLFMMGSNGGLISVERSCRQPVSLVESGPIGGCIGAGAYARSLGIANLIAFDMGGTTAKCALIDDGRYSVDSVYYVNGYVRGFPIKAPVIDIVEVGSGGGSIAWLDAQKRLHVGPVSAGASPGPACYGAGGEEPTVTDANLVLGRLNPARFLGGKLALDPALARTAIAERVAAPLGYSGEEGLLEMADGIVRIAIVAMAGAIRRVSVEHGLDPRDFALFAYGGGGPLHAAALARELAIPTVIVPPEPGNFSAIGMLLADARIDAAETFTGPLDGPMVAAMEARFAALEDEARTALARDFGDAEVYFERHAEMRYRGQRHNIKVPVTGLSDVDALAAAFAEDYRRRYGHADARAEVEFQALHLAAFAALRRPDIARLARRGGETRAEGARPVHFGGADMVESRILDRASLAPGFAGAGPAVIEEYGSTTLIAPGDVFEVGAMGEIRIRCGAG